MKLFLKAMHDGKELHAYNRQWFRQAMRLPLVMASYMALLDLMIVCHRLDMLRLPLVMASYMALLDLMIACRCLDMPPSAIRTQAESVWLMRYAIKHAHGVSEDEYQGTIFEPLFGTSQGNGSSPTI